MTAVDKLRAADQTLRRIDAALRPPIDLDNLLCHPGQLHVPIADYPWYRAWVEGRISDNQAQELADELTADELDAERGRFYCWYCKASTRNGDMHARCETAWASVVRRTRPARKPRHEHAYEPGPERGVELVDGIGVRLTGYPAQHLARLK